MSSGSVEQHIAILHKMFSLSCQVREIGHFEGKMMHLDGACLCEGQTVMIRITAHPQEDIVDPVGDTEPQHLAIELRTAFAIIHKQCDMAKLTWLYRTRTVGWSNLGHTSDQFYDIAIRITQA